MPGLKITEFRSGRDPAVAIAAASAASSTPLGGDLSGTPGSATVVAVGGISITGSPSGAGDEIIATSTTAAHWATPAGGAVALDDLSDVTITTPATADHLRFDGSLWRNSALRWEPHVAYDGTAVLDGNGDPVMVEMS